jgi:hypothetical protein
VAAKAPQRRPLGSALAAVVPLGIGLMVASWWVHRSRGSVPPRDEMEVASERLRTFDATRRIGADFAHLPTWDEISGPDPYVLAKVPHWPRVVGLLRGDDAIVVLDEAMQEIERLPAPASPVALAVADDGAILVVGEQSSVIARYAWHDARLEPAGTWNLDDIRAIRGIAAGASGWVYVAEEQQGRLIALRVERRAAQDRIVARTEMGRCRGPVRLMRIAGPAASHERRGDRLIANCLLDHSLIIHDLEPSGAPSAAPPLRIHHDGPIWSFDAVATPDSLLIAAGGVEDRPLDRTIGAFGYIDSFLFLYRVDAAGRPPVREAAVNLSELGVVTPKAIVLKAEPLAVTVSGYGSDKLVDLAFSEGAARPPAVRVQTFVPGTSAVVAIDEARLVFADPLLDAWVVPKTGAPPAVFPVAARTIDRHPAEPEVRFGESLFFTTLMAPFNGSEGALSRFTCETCHYEGYVDGRTHHTGRDDVHAVTKPLLGLFNNRPHFSRALDPDLTAVVFNEFRVAGAKSGHDPWFSVSANDAPWLRSLGWTDAILTPETMRKALMTFLIAFQHRPNPAVIGRTSFSDREREGAALFRDRCEACHESRLASDQPASRVPFAAWEGLVMAREGAIVWGKDVYAQSGVVPYVHEKGARIPSLRRLYKKHPYFTNGSADTLAEVLARARFLPSGFQHVAAVDAPLAGATENADIMLDAPSRSALAAFLDLL